MHAPEPVTANWGFPTKVWFGAGRLRDLPVAVKQCRASRPLLVTDRGLAALPMVADAVALLAEAGLPCRSFGEVKPHPTGANIDAGVAAFRDGDHDLVIALGGGSGLCRRRGSGGGLCGLHPLERRGEGGDHCSLFPSLRTAAVTLRAVGEQPPPFAVVRNVWRGRRGGGGRGGGRCCHGAALL